MFESPLDVDYPHAMYRVDCPTCRQGLWAGMTPPPVQGEEIIAQHECPGPWYEIEPPPEPALESPLWPEPTPTADGFETGPSSEVSSQVDMVTGPGLVEDNNEDPVRMFRRLNTGSDEAAVADTDTGERHEPLPPPPPLRW